MKILRKQTKKNSAFFLFSFFFFFFGGKREKQKSPPHPATAPGPPPRRTSSPSSVRVRRPRVAHRLVDRQDQSRRLGRRGDGVVFDEGRLPDEGLKGVDDAARLVLVLIFSVFSVLDDDVSASLRAFPSGCVPDVDPHPRSRTILASMRRPEPVEHRRRVEPSVVAQLAGDRLEGFREGLEEELVPPGDRAGVLAEVADMMRKREIFGFFFLMI